MSAALPMRPYQIEAVRAAEAAWARGLRRPAEVLPTGTGKTVVIAHVVERRHQRPYAMNEIGRRTLVMAHRTELVEQAYEKIKAVDPGLRVGIVQGQRNETGGDVVCASVQTLASEDRRRMIADVGLVIVDEAHHAAADTYLRVLRHYGAWGDDAPVGQQARAVALGFTATMVRGDEKALGDVWQEVVYARGIQEMIEAGYLVRPRGVHVEVDDLDLSRVRVSRGDFQGGDLGRAITDSMAPAAIAKAISEHASGMCGIIFAPTVESAKVVAEAVAATGRRVGFVSGTTPAAERRQLWRDFEAGRIDWIANCGVATEGTDLPRAQVAVIARPTRSQGLYIQMAGRVLRPYPGKEFALLLDVVGATKEHSLQSPLSLFGEEAPTERGEREPRNDVELEGLDDAQEQGGAVSADLFGAYAGKDGPLVSREVDLFHASASMWHRTAGGIWFLAAGKRYIALIPGVEVGTWDVTEMDAERRGTGKWIINGVRDMSYAMGWAEGAVTPAEKLTASKERAWRKEKPSDAQRGMARRWGVPLLPDMSKGEVSARLTVAIATQRIDPCVPMYARGRS